MDHSPTDILEYVRQKIPFIHIVGMICEISISCAEDDLPCLCSQELFLRLHH